MASSDTYSRGDSHSTLAGSMARSSQGTKSQRTLMGVGEKTVPQIADSCGTVASLIS